VADYPCDLHLARYQGPSCRVYINVYREDQEIRLKASSCADCLTAALADFVSRALRIDSEGVWNPPQDGEDLEALWNRVGEPSGRLNGYKRR
jgi:hypothetical protein